MKTFIWILSSLVLFALILFLAMTLQPRHFQGTMMFKIQSPPQKLLNSLTNPLLFPRFQNYKNISNDDGILTAEYFGKKYSYSYHLPVSNSVVLHLTSQDSNIEAVWKYEIYDNFSFSVLSVSENSTIVSPFQRLKFAFIGRTQTMQNNIKLIRHYLKQAHNDN